MTAQPDVARRDAPGAGAPPYRYTAALAERDRGPLAGPVGGRADLRDAEPVGPAGGRLGARPGREVLPDGHVPVPARRGAARRAPAGLHRHRRARPLPAHDRAHRAAHDGLRRLRAARRAVRGADRHAPADHHRGERRRATAPRSAASAWPTTSAARSPPPTRSSTAGPSGSSCRSTGRGTTPTADRARPITELEAEFAAGDARRPRTGATWSTLSRPEQDRVLDGHRLAYLAEAPVNWCPALGTVLSNEEVTADGRSERGNFPVFRRNLRQWMMRITAYADRLADDLDGVDWPDSVKAMQRNWIGRSQGATVRFARSPVPPTRSRSSRRGPTRSSAPPTWSWPPSTRWSTRSCPRRGRSRGPARSSTGAGPAAPPPPPTRSPATAASSRRAPTWSARRPATRRACSPAPGRPTRSTASRCRSSSPTTSSWATAPARSWPSPARTSATGTSRPSSACRSAAPCSRPRTSTAQACTGAGAAINSANDAISLDGLGVAEAKSAIIDWLAGRGDGEAGRAVQAARLAVQPPALLGRAVPGRLRRRRRVRRRPVDPAGAARRRPAGAAARRRRLLPQVVRPRRPRLLAGVAAGARHGVDVVLRRPRRPTTSGPGRATSARRTRCRSGPAPAGTTCATSTRRTPSASSTPTSSASGSGPRPEEFGAGRPGRRRPLRRRRRARGAAPALRAVLAEGALRPGPRERVGAVPPAVQPGLHPGLGLHRRPRGLRAGGGGRGDRTARTARHDSRGTTARSPASTGRWASRCATSSPPTTCARPTAPTPSGSTRCRPGRWRPRAPGRPATSSARSGSCSGRGGCWSTSTTASLRVSDAAPVRRDDAPAAPGDRRGARRLPGDALQHRRREAHRADQPPDQDLPRRRACRGRCRRAAGAHALAAVPAPGRGAVVAARATPGRWPTGRSPRPTRRCWSRRRVEYPDPGQRARCARVSRSPPTPPRPRCAPRPSPSAKVAAMVDGAEPRKVIVVPGPDGQHRAVRAAPDGRTNRAPRDARGVALRAGSAVGQASPRMNSSTRSWAAESRYCSGGDFMKYDDGPSSGPPMPRSSAIFAARTASMMMPGRVRGVPDLELVLERQRDVAEGATLEPDVGPLAVVEPRHVVRRADVDVATLPMSRSTCEVTDWVFDVFFDSRRSRSSMFWKSMLPPTLSCIVRSSCTPRSSKSFASTRWVMVAPTWRLDVVADDRHAGGGELRRPLGVGGDEHGQRVDEGDARVERALRVELVGVLAAHRQVGHEHVGARLAQRRDHVDRLLVGLGDRLAVVAAQPVEGVAALHGHAGRRHVGDLDGVVLAGADGLGEVLADLLRVDVERRHEVEVADVVAAEVDVHETRHAGGRVGVGVVVHALDQRRGAVAHADDGDTDLTHGSVSFAAVVVLRVRGRRPARCRPVAAARSCVDELVEPAHLALGGVEPEAVQLAGVAVDLLPGAGAASARRPSRRSSTRRRLPSRIRMPHLGGRAGEEGEVDPEAVVVEGLRARTRRAARRDGPCPRR